MELTRLRYLIIIFLFGTLFIGCHSLKFEPEEKVKQCLNQCLTDFQYCQNICFNNCSQCCGINLGQATEKYARYENQNQIEGKPAIHWLQYYDDQLKCNKNSCDCQSDHLLCKQHCTGKYIRRLQVYKYC
ncbi:MAG: hypothetical protein EBQ95_05620 [Gammaproteobacteria bacterium]|nr:hypothetical protein [Gammaproteobacteria bacterium]